MLFTSYYAFNFMIINKIIIKIEHFKKIKFSIHLNIFLIIKKHLKSYFLFIKSNKNNKN